MAKLRIFQLLCLIAFTSAQLDFEDDEPEDLFDNSFTRELGSALFGDDIKTITIFSDFENANDRFFFQNVLPWLVDQIGSYLRINYRFRNSARSAGPRGCALRGLRSNTYLQAEFLRCEARGTAVSNCISQSPIDMRSYQRCVTRRIHSHVRNSQWDWERMISDRTPTILVGNRREILANDPARLLRLLCQEFGRSKPTGCLTVTNVPGALAQAPAQPVPPGPAPVFNNSTRNGINDDTRAIIPSGSNVFAVSDPIKTVIISVTTTKKNSTETIDRPLHSVLRTLI